LIRSKAVPRKRGAPKTPVSEPQRRVVHEFNRLVRLNETTDDRDTESGIARRLKVKYPAVLGSTKKPLQEIRRLQKRLEQ
jgi:hypothetical protein